MTFHPSIYAHIINGILLLLAIVLLCKNYSKIQNMQPSIWIVLVLLFSIAVGIHGLSHFALEYKYHYNPLWILNQFRKM